MTAGRCLLAMLPFLLSACDRQPHDAAPSKPVSAADRALIETGLSADAVAAARAYLVPFTRADQSACFGDVALTGAEMQPKQDDIFTAAPDVSRVVVAIDGSGSMAARIGGQSKLALAKRATGAFLDSLGPQVDASLLAFGQQGDNSDTGKARSCRAIDQLAPPSRDHAALRRSVETVRAVGWTPLAAALQRAQAQLAASTQTGRQIVYVVSDGNETCGGDPVAAARALNTGSTRAIVNIIGFDLPAADLAALGKVAGAGGGRVLNIADDVGYRRMIAATRESMRRNGNLIRAGGARADTTIDTGAAITHATLCTGEIVTRETTQVGADLTRRTTAGEAVPERHVVFAVLDQRHKAMAARRDAFAARLKGARDRQIDTIDASVKASE